MFIIKKYRPGRPKSPWALYSSTSLKPNEDELIALFTYRKGAHKVLELLMEREKLQLYFQNFHLISDLMVADKPLRRQ